MSGKVHSFQVDDDIVRHQREEDDNYIIEYNAGAADKKLCALYFSSNDIYYPNNENAFRFSILTKNHYEWRNCKVKAAYKHIFLRDVNKQWYLSGINNRLSDPDKLLSFLKKETDGFDIVTIGSSAGGYAAILYGILLRAKHVLAFNAQIEIASLLKTDEGKNPLVFRLKDTPARKFYDLVPFIAKSGGISINYFVSVNSPWDKIQISHITDENVESNMNIIRFNSDHHGIPFPKVALNAVINGAQPMLNADSGKLNHPIRYSVDKIGLINTLVGISRQLYQAIGKHIKRKL